MQFLNEKEQFFSKTFRVVTFDAIHPKIGVVKRAAVDHCNATVILPFLSSTEIILLKNQRDVVQEKLLELPAGCMEEGENPLECAHRELLEESGFRAMKMEPLCEFYTTPGFCTEYLHIFAAYDLVFEGQNLDESEEIEVLTLSLEDAYDLIDRKEIKDGKTITALLMHRIRCLSHK